MRAERPDCPEHEHGATRSIAKTNRRHTESQLSRGIAEAMPAALEKTTIGELLDLSPAVRRYLLARVPDI